MKKNRYYEPKTGYIYQWLVTDGYPRGAMFLEHGASGSLARTVWTSVKFVASLSAIATRRNAIRLLGLKPLPSSKWRAGVPKINAWYSTEVGALPFWRDGGRVRFRFLNQGFWSNGVESDTSISFVFIRASIDSGYKDDEIKYCLHWPEWAKVPPPIGYFEQ